MNKFMWNTIRVGMVTCLGLGLYACGGGPVGIPTRNKMPELVGSDRFEGTLSPDQSVITDGITASIYAATPIDLQLSGHKEGFYKIPLPDAANDSLAFQLLNNLRPFALPLLMNWAKQERHGVLLDLSSVAGQAMQQSDFDLKIPGYSIPVRVTWDETSAYRVKNLIQFMQGEPAIQFIKTN